MPKPDGLRMDITLRALDLCLISVCVDLRTNCRQNTIRCPSPTGYRWISRLAPLTCVKQVFVLVYTQIAYKPQFVPKPDGPRMDITLRATLELHMAKSKTKALGRFKSSGLGI